MLNEFNGVKEIIFDFDDTLIHSGQSVVECVLRVADKLSLHKPSVDDIRRLMGIPLVPFVKALWPQVDGEEVLQAYLDNYKKDSLVKVEGTSETLNGLRNLGFRLHILSSKRTVNLLDHMKHIGIESNLFTSIIGGEAVLYNKPDGRVFNGFLEKYDVNEIVYVGDSLHDLEAALNAGMKFIAVLTGIISKEEFVNAGAEVIVDSVCGLKGLFENSS